MKQNYKKYIDKILENLNSIIPVEWDAIYFAGDIWTGRTSGTCMFFFIERSTGKLRRGLDIVDEFGMDGSEFEKSYNKLIDFIFDFYDYSAENYNNTWTFVRINWSDKENFKYCFDYCNRDELGWDRMLSELIWAYETFGDLPPENSYERKVLDKFINSGEKSPFQNELS